MSLSHQNRWLRDQDRRDGAGRMGAGWRWRAQEPHPGGCARYDPGRVEMARTGAAHLASPRTLPRHHADPDQSGGLPGEKDSVSISRWGGRCGAGDRCEGAGGGGCAGVRGGRSRQGGGLRGAGGAVQSGGSGSVPCSSRCACRSRQGRSEAPAGARSARLGARGSGRVGPGVGASAAAAVRAGARGGAVCPNLLQRPGPSRSTGRETLIFRASTRGRSRRETPLQQIRTRPRPGSPQEPHPHHNPPQELLAETSSPETRRVPRTCRRRPPTVSPVREHSRAPLSPGPPRPLPLPRPHLSTPPFLDRGLERPP